MKVVTDASLLNYLVLIDAEHDEAIRQALPRERPGKSSGTKRRE
jgi:hypothetical protein